MAEEIRLELKATGDEKNQIATACNGCDMGVCDENVRDWLEMRYDENEQEIESVGRWAWWKADKARRENRRIKRVLSKKRVFRKFADRVIHESKQALVNSGRLSEFGDGSFLQWWWEWFEENSDVLIQFIKELFEIIMTVIVSFGPVIGLIIAGAILASYGLSWGEFLFLACAI